MIINSSKTFASALIIVFVNYIWDWILSLKNWRLFKKDWLLNGACAFLTKWKFMKIKFLKILMISCLIEDWLSCWWFRKTFSKCDWLQSFKNLVCDWFRNLKVFNCNWLWNFVDLICDWFWNSTNRESAWLWNLKIMKERLLIVESRLKMFCIFWSSRFIFKVFSI